MADQMPNSPSGEAVWLMLQVGKEWDREIYANQTSILEWLRSLGHEIDDEEVKMTTMLALPPPQRLLENSRRLTADEVPRDYERFRKWAEYACPEFNGEMHILSYHAHQLLKKQQYPEQYGYMEVSETAFSDFISVYDSWFNLSEAEKEHLMTEGQIYSPRRSYFRKMALEAAAGIISERRGYR